MVVMRILAPAVIRPTIVAGLATVLFACGPSATEAPNPPATPATAQQVIAEAVSRAQAEQKVVLIEFGASWCKWCTNFQRFVHAPQVGATMADNYVVANLDVLEEPEKKSLENPQGEALMLEYTGGKKAGLPFYVFLDARGNKIADSYAMPDKSNIGFPATPEEIDAFMALLDRTAPRLDAPGRAAVVAYLHATAKL
jgi:thiol:disulfide interchange protein